MMNLTGKNTRLYITVACLLGALSAQAEDVGALRIKAPAFTARDLRNKLVSTDSLLAKGPLIIDFWATWCVPCKEEFEALKKTLRTFSGKNLTVLAVNEDGPSEIAKVKQMVAMRKLPFVVVMDNGKAIMRNYNVTALPTLFLIGTDGTIRYFSRGYISGDEVKLEEKLHELFTSDKQH